MAIYVIGDIQGCFKALQQLLQKIRFSPHHDRLWFAGDLVNRGPDSLAVLRFIKSLGNAALSILGNHDLTLLAMYYGYVEHKKTDTLRDILEAEDREALCEWLLHCPLLHHDPHHQVTLVHAGFPPQWDLTTAQSCAHELSTALEDKQTRMSFLSEMYGDEPKQWNPSLSGQARLRFICNSLTRIRYVTTEGCIDLHYKGTIEEAPAGLIPWFEHPHRKTQDEKIIFGHWASLMGKTRQPNAIGIDTGCYWGGCLTAYCLETGERITVNCT